jgi:hypothetical protein
MCTANAQLVLQTAQKSAQGDEFRCKIEPVKKKKFQQKVYVSHKEICATRSFRDG